MAEDKELEIPLQGMKVDGEKKKGPKPIAGPQINRSRKGSTLTAEEKAAKRAKARKAKERKTKNKSSNAIEPSVLTPKADQLPEQVVSPTKVSIISQPHVTPVPAPTTVITDAPKTTPRPVALPPEGTSPSNPIKVHGVDPYSVVERLYGEIGYFILAEQMVPKASPPVKLIQIKLDDDRFINLFLEI